MGVVDFVYFVATVLLILLFIYLFAAQKYVKFCLLVLSIANIDILAVAILE